MSSFSSRWGRRTAGACAFLAGLVLSGVVVAAVGSAAPGASSPLRGPRVRNSTMDGSLFYQLLVGELELREGAAGDAYLAMLDAAKRTNDEALFRRAVEIALQARAGDQALSAVRAWRSAQPHSTEAIRYEIELLMALNRPAEAMTPVGDLLRQSPPKERAGIIASLPRFLARANDHQQAAVQAEALLKPYLEQPDTRTAARVAMGRLWFAAGDTPKATALLELARKDDPDAPGPVLLALEMMPRLPAEEQVVREYLQRPKAEPVVRLAYVRTLTTMERYADAAQQLEQVTRDKPQVAAPWLTLGALQLELHHPDAAEAALRHYVALAQDADKAAATAATAASGPASAPAAAEAAPASEPADADDEDDSDDDMPSPAAARAGNGSPTAEGLTQAWLLLSQAAEMRGDYRGAEAWLARIDSPQRALEVQTRRASILAHEGKIDQARALIRQAPERSPEDARAKLLAEAQILSDAKRWRDAEGVLAQANQRFPDDPDLLYEQAMLDERLDRLDDMERLLRKVIALKPDNQNAYNALGYSLADHNQRLPEAKALIEKALQLSPGEPFITDSLGWVDFKMGQTAEAEKLLRQAYTARPDPEIAAHLGEVLWAQGRHDEARQVLLEAHQRDAGNEALNKVMSKFKVQP
jgi:tetratricopeptide (TPR) repeat protein